MAGKELINEPGFRVHWTLRWSRHPAQWVETWSYCTSHHQHIITTHMCHSL